MVVDAKGVGAGLTSFLEEALGARAGQAGRVIPVRFSRKVKSNLGWDFVGVVETGRYRDYVRDGARETRQFWYEVESCQREVSSDPNHTMRWGIRDAVAHDGLIAYGHDQRPALRPAGRRGGGPARSAAVEAGESAGGDRR